MSDFIKALSQMTQYPVPGRLDVDPSESHYLLPNTVNECSRLNLQHAIIQQYLSTNSVAPIGHPQTISAPSGSWTGLVVKQAMQQSTAAGVFTPKRILDVGCGTGRWAIEMAQQFPNTHVVGIDIVNPVRAYAHDAPLPVNYSFFRGNILRGLPSFADGTFDYVHMRFLGTGIPGQQWQMVINELARLTSPGGWIEIIDYTLPINMGPVMAQVVEMLKNALTVDGIDLKCCRIVDTFLRQAHPPMTAISNRMLEMPLGAQGGTLGSRMAWNLIFSLSNLREYFLQAGVFKTDEWETLVQEMEAEASNQDYRPLLPLYITIGQRKA
jgi:ubiquinone/menaquinone biosynthesis C-methylase UbiE